MAETNGLMALYKLHVRRIADSYPDLVEAAKNEMPQKSMKSYAKCEFIRFAKRS